MRDVIDGKYAVYQSETYKVVDISGSEVLLVTEDAASELKGFQAETTTHTLHTLYYKHVQRDKLDELYELFQEARYQGAIFDYYQDNEGNHYIGTNDQEKANTFGLVASLDDYYSAVVAEEDIEKIIHRHHLE